MTLYLPTACYACSRTWLAAPSFDLPATCPFCHGPAHVVPGESYRVEDIPLFDRLEKALLAAQPSEPASHRLWVTLSNVSERWRRPEGLVFLAIDTIPGLQFLIEAFANDRTQLARAVGMLLTVLNTRLRTFEGHRLSPDREPQPSPATPR